MTLGIYDSSLSIVAGLMCDIRKRHLRTTCENIAAKWNSGDMTVHGLYVAFFNLDLYWPYDELSLSIYINGNLIPWHICRGDGSYMDWHSLAMLCMTGGRWAMRPRLKLVCYSIQDQMYFNSEWCKYDT